MRFSKRELFDLTRVTFWILLLIPAYFLDWLSNVTFVSLLSLWALVETAWAAYRGGSEKQLDKIEVKLDKLLDELDVD